MPTVLPSPWTPASYSGVTLYCAARSLTVHSPGSLPPPPPFFRPAPCVSRDAARLESARSAGGCRADDAVDDSRDVRGGDGQLAERRVEAHRRALASAGLHAGAAPRRTRPASPSRSRSLRACGPSCRTARPAWRYAVALARVTGPGRSAHRRRTELVELRPRRVELASSASSWSASRCSATR